MGIDCDSVYSFLLMLWYVEEIAMSPLYGLGHSNKDMLTLYILVMLPIGCIRSGLMVI